MFKPSTADEADSESKRTSLPSAGGFSRVAFLAGKKIVSAVAVADNAFASFCALGDFP
jgi:hypothetical protein